MNITQELSLDLTRRESSTPVLDLVQGDTVRKIRLKLLRDGEPWFIPEDAVVILRYLKPDGTGGAYDTLDDGTRAWSVLGNTVYLSLAPRVCTASGMVQLQVSINKEKEQLSTFSFLLRADKEINGEGESGEYANLAAWMEKHGRGEKGDPGVSPVVEISDIPDGHRVTITDVNGVKFFDVPNSQIPTAHLLRIAALEDKAIWELSGTGSVTFEAPVDSCITFVGRMTPAQSGEGNPSPENIRPITVTETVNVSIADAGGVTQQSHSIALPAPCGAGHIDWARRKYVQTHALAELPIASMNNSDDYPGWTGQAWLKNAKMQNKWYLLEAETNIGVIPYGRADWQLCYFAQSEFGYSQTELKEQFPNLVVQILYELQTPVEYDLGELPTLKALEGTTVFSCDTNGGFTVQYNHDELAVANWEKLRDRTDFVIAEGVSGVWHYRKWDSGLAECWGKVEKTVDISNELGSVYSNGAATDTTIMYPFKFVEIPNCTFSVVANYAIWYGGGSAISSSEWEIPELLKSQTPKVYIWKPSPTTDVIATIHFDVKGRWK